MTRQTPHRLGRPHRRLDCLVYRPGGYQDSSDQRWPLIFFLHGAGERGRDVEQLKKHGIPRVVEDSEDFPFIAVSPQCPPDLRWTHITAELWAVLDDATSQLAVDPERVYLTGLSMGAFGAWRMAAEEPDRFAAMATVCGGGDPSWAPLLARLPIWAFHGSDDKVVPSTATTRMVEALRALKAPVRFTLYPGVGHDAWTRTYANPELYAWFLDHRRAAAS